MSIRAKLTVWLGGILLASLTVMAVVLYYEWIEQQHRLTTTGKEPEPAWEEVGEIVVLYGLPTTLLLLGGSWWLLRTSLAPVTGLTRAAESIDIHNLKNRLPQTGNGDELDRLTQVFNLMMDRLDESFSRIREFTLNASHELKTPLTVMRAAIETRLRSTSTVCEPDFLADLLDEINRLAKIVDALAFLSKADSGHIVLAHDPVRLDRLVRESFADAQVLAGPSRLRVELLTCDDTTVVGDRHRLKQLLLNLADNAIKYNQPGGAVTIALSRRNGLAELAITNTGPGIPEEKLPRVFDRFYRGDLSHNSNVEGCGLGLNIAEWIVKAHGGSIQVTSEPHKVTTVRVELPASSS